MTIFDYIKDIVVTKKGNLPLGEYVPYLINRWLSFLDPTVCDVINSYSNSKFLLENKNMHYQLMISLFPKLKSCPRISYIKKNKEEIVQEDFKLKILAENLEISKREILMLMSVLETH